MDFVTFMRILTVFATVMLTLEGAWILYTTREDPKAKALLTTPSFTKRRKKICLLFPAYKDEVRLESWLKWAQGEDVTFVIAEDMTRKNERYKDVAMYMHRDNRDGFKAGAINYVLDQLMARDVKFDYIIIADADHVPFNNSIKEIYGYLNHDLIQFFWYDGLPLNSALTWLTYSSRYFSNWNLYNRKFPNLTGSGIAISYKFVSAGLRFPQSITEDYALTLATVDKSSVRVTVIPYVLCIGTSPKNFRVYVKQQLRWAEGTIRDAKRYFVKTMFNDTLTAQDKWDFLMHVNMYAQGPFLVINIAVLLAGYGVGSFIAPIILFQGIAYFKTLSKTPKRYWATYFIMNYFMALVQVYAVARALFVNKGNFYATDKTGMYSTSVAK